MCENYTLDCKKEEMTCKGCAYCEKSADEMFEELGYEKFLYYKNILTYDNEDTTIEFWLERKEVEVDDNINMQVLKAINKKVEELGWE